MNIYSLAEETDEVIKAFARELLKNRQISFFGSDAHRSDHRPYKIKSGIDYILRNCSTEYIEDIMYRNAGKVINK